jgi:hypothetical protein
MHLPRGTSTWHAFASSSVRREQQTQLLQQHRPPPTNAATVGAKTQGKESPSIGIVGILVGERHHYPFISSANTIKQLYLSIW